jgi:MarR family transcriptional regulator, negative regulator of the multidrug operon emrRAB
MSDKNLSSFDALQKRLAIIKKMRPDFPVEYTRLVRLIANVHQRTVDVYNDLLKQFGLTYRTYSALMSIYSSGKDGITPSELAEAMGEKRTNITRLCDELLEMNLIVREFSVTDRRSFHLQVAPDGEALIDSLAPRIKDLLTALYAPLTRKEMNDIEAGLYKKLQVLVQMNKQALSRTED